MDGWYGWFGRMDRLDVWFRWMVQMEGSDGWFRWMDEREGSEGGDCGGGVWDGAEGWRGGVGRMEDAGVRESGGMQWRGVVVWWCGGRGATPRSTGCRAVLGTPRQRPKPRAPAQPNWPTEKSGPNPPQQRGKCIAHPNIEGALCTRWPSTSSPGRTGPAVFPRARACQHPATQPDWGKPA